MICGTYAPRSPPPIRRRRESSIEFFFAEHSERQPRAQLNFPPGRHGHGDRTELRSIHVPVGCAQVDLIQRIEGLAPELEAGLLGETERARQGEVESLQWRTVNRVPPDIAKRVRGRRRERRLVEPLGGRARPRTEYWLASNVGPYGIFSQHRAGICGVSKYRDG